MKTLIVLFIASICTLKASAQLELYGRYTKGGKIAPDINLYGEKKMTSTLNLTYFLLVEQKWSEALVGFSYSPTKSISFGASTGIEQSPDIYRFGAFVWMGKDRTSLLVLTEKGVGSDNYWYKATAGYKVSNTFTTGLRAWRYHGIGPVETFNVKKSPISLWIMPARDIEYHQSRLMIVIDVKI